MRSIGEDVTSRLQTPALTVSVWLALLLLLEGSQCWVPEQMPGSMFLPNDHHLLLSPSPSVTGSCLSLVLALGSQEQVLYHRAILTSSHSSIWRQSLAKLPFAKLPKLALNSLCSPGLPRMCAPPASVSRVAGITGQSHQALSELGF